MDIIQHIKLYKCRCIHATFYVSNSASLHHMLSGFLTQIQPFCAIQMGLASGQRLAEDDAFCFVFQGRASNSIMLLPFLRHAMQCLKPPCGKVQLRL